MRTIIVLAWAWAIWVAWREIVEFLEEKEEEKEKESEAAARRP